LPFKKSMVTREQVNDAMNNAIVNFFQKPPQLMPQKALDQLILSNKDPKTNEIMKFTSSNVSSLMFIAAKQTNRFGRKIKMQLSIAHHVPYLVDILEKHGDEPVTNKDLSNICYGLKSLKELTKVPESTVDENDNNDSSQLTLHSKDGALSQPVTRLLELVTAKLDKFEGQLTKVDTGKILFGLQGNTIHSMHLEICVMARSVFCCSGLSSDSLEVRKMLPVISKCISKNLQGDEASGMNSRAIGSAFFGMQGLSSKHPEVRELLTVMKSKVEQSERILDSQALASAMYGLQRMTSGHQEVLDTVKLLAGMCAESKYKMNTIELSNAFYGMKCLSSNSPEVRELLAALNTKLEENDDRFNAQSIGMLVFGLRGMDSAHEEVKDVLLTMARKLDRRAPKFDKKAVIQACSGCKHLSADHAETRIFLMALRLNILRSEISLNSEDMRLCVNGLRALYFKSNKDSPVQVDKSSNSASPAPVPSKVYTNLESKYKEVEAVMAALRSLSENPGELDELMLHYANKTEWHYTTNA
jgi:hypothetical protein